MPTEEQRRCFSLFEAALEEERRLATLVAAARDRTGTVPDDLWSEWMKSMEATNAASRLLRDSRAPSG